MSEESSIKNFEWHRERVLKEKNSPNPYSDNRIGWNARQVEKSHGRKAVNELAREFNSKSRNKSKKYFT